MLIPTIRKKNITVLLGVVLVLFTFPYIISFISENGFIREGPGEIGPELPDGRDDLTDDRSKFDSDDGNLIYDPNANPDAAGNLIDLYDNNSLFWNGSIGWDSHIEYNPVSNTYYTLNSFRENSTENSTVYYNMNLTAWDENLTVIWSKSIGDYNITEYPQGFLMAPDSDILYIIETVGESIFFGSDYNKTVIIALNSSDGSILWNITVADAAENSAVYVTRSYLDDTGRFMYLIGTVYVNDFYPGNLYNGDLILMKIDLHDRKVVWNCTWGSGEYDEEGLSVAIYRNGTYFYAVGYQYSDPDANPTAYFNAFKNETLPGRRIFLAINSTGSVLTYNLYDSNGPLTDVPKDMVLSDDNSRLYLLSTYRNKYYDLAENISFEVLYLNGSVEERYTYNYDSLTRESALRLIKSPWNDTFYILGKVTTSDYQKALIMEISKNGTELWMNATRIPGIEYYDGYYDAVITEENSHLVIIGFKTVAINETKMHIYSYFLDRAPAPPRLRADNGNPGQSTEANTHLSYNGQVKLEWNAVLRADNYSIYRSESPFADPSEALYLGTVDGTNFTESAPGNGLYYYGVQAAGAYGNGSLSNILQIYVTDNGSTFLYEPVISYTDNDREINRSGMNVRLQWIGITGAQRYFIYRNNSADFNLSLCKPIGETGIPEFSDEDVPSGNWSYAVVCEINNGTLFNSTVSNIRNVTVAYRLDAVNITVNEYPEIYSADNPSYDLNITIRWKPAFYTDNYSIHRSTEPFTECNSSNLIAEGLTSLSYNDSVPDYGVYYYRVVSHNTTTSRMSDLFEIYASTFATPYLNPFNNDTIYLPPGQNGTIVIRWNLNNNSNDVYPIKFYVYRNTVNEFNLSELDPIAVLSETAMEYEDKNLTENTYYYAVLCTYFESGLKNSSLSNVQSVTFTHQSLIPDFVIVKNLHVGEIILHWNPIPGAVGYRIYRMVNCPVTRDDLDRIEPVKTVSDLSYKDCPEPNARYFWSIVAYNASGSAVAFKVVSAFIYKPLTAPTLYGPEYNVTDGYVPMNWTDDGESQYIFIFKDYSPIETLDNLEPINYTAGNESEIADYTSYLGNLYYVVVRWEAPGYIGPISNCINVSLQDLPGMVDHISFENPLLYGPPDYSDGYITGNRYVNLSWSEVDGALYYEIYRSSEYIDSSLSWATLIGQTNKTIYIDNDVEDNDIWYYSVRAVNYTGPGTPAHCVKITVQFTSDPVNVSVVQGANRSAVISWTPGTYLDVQHYVYYVYRHTMPFNATYLEQHREELLINAIRKNAVNYSCVDPNLNASSTYYYAVEVLSVMATNVSFYSNISNIAQITIIPTPYQPYLEQPESPNYSGNVTLSWHPPSINATYTIYREDYDFSETPIESLTPYICNLTELNYTDVNLPPGVWYYAVMATNSTGNSTLSRIVSIEVISLPIAPDWTTENDSIFVNWINLTWSDPYGYGNYSVYRCNNSAFNAGESVLIAGNVNTTYLIDIPPDEGIYYYRIIAGNSSGYTQWSMGSDLRVQCFKIGPPRIEFPIGTLITNHTLYIELYKDPHATHYYIYRVKSPESFDEFEPFSFEEIYSLAATLTPYAVVDVSEAFGSGGDDPYLYSERIMPLGRYYYLILPVYRPDANLSPLYGNCSDVFAIRVEDLPDAPNITLVERGLYDSIIVHWEPVPNADYYIVYISDIPINDSTPVANLTSSPLLSSDINEFTFENAGYGVHYIAVVAVNNTGASPFSEIYVFDNSVHTVKDNTGIILGAGLGASAGIASIVLYYYWRTRKRTDPKDLF